MHAGALRGRKASPPQRAAPGSAQTGWPENIAEGGGKRRGGCRGDRPDVPVVGKGLAKAIANDYGRVSRDAMRCTAIAATTTVHIVRTNGLACARHVIGMLAALHLHARRHGVTTMGRGRLFRHAAMTMLRAHERRQRRHGKREREPQDDEDAECWHTPYWHGNAAIANHGAAGGGPLAPFPPGKLITPGPAPIVAPFPRFRTTSHAVCRLWPAVPRSLRAEWPPATLRLRR